MNGLIHEKFRAKSALKCTAAKRVLRVVHCIIHKKFDVLNSSFLRRFGKIIPLKLIFNVCRLVQNSI